MYFWTYFYEYLPHHIQKTNVLYDSVSEEIVYLLELIFQTIKTCN